MPTLDSTNLCAPLIGIYSQCCIAGHLRPPARFLLPDGFELAFDIILFHELNLLYTTGLDRFGLAL